MISLRRYRFRRRGITLLEVILSMALLAVLTSMTYWFYFSVLDTRRTGGVDARKLRLVRVVLNRIEKEIRQASATTIDGQTGIHGEAERIWLSTVRVPGNETLKRYSFSPEPPPAEYDLIKTEYKIARHPEITHEDGYEMPLGLARVEIRIPRPDSAETGEAFEDEARVVGSGEEADAFADAALDEALLGDLDDESDPSIGPQIEWEELYAPELHYLRFCYFDGHTWWDDWEIGGDHPLPQLVMVTVGFEGHAPFGEEFGRNDNEEFCECLGEDPQDCLPLPRDQYSVVIRVPQADPLFRSRIGRESQAFMQQLSGGEE